MESFGKKAILKNMQLLSDSLEARHLLLSLFELNVINLEQLEQMHKSELPLNDQMMNLLFLLLRQCPWRKFMEALKAVKAYDWVRHLLVRCEIGFKNIRLLSQRPRISNTARQLKHDAILELLKWIRSGQTVQFSINVEEVEQRWHRINSSLDVSPTDRLVAGDYYFAFREMKAYYLHQENSSTARDELRSNLHIMNNTIVSTSDPLSSSSVFHACVALAEIDDCTKSLSNIDLAIGRAEDLGFCRELAILFTARLLVLAFLYHRHPEAEIKEQMEHAARIAEICYEQEEEDGFLTRDGTEQLMRIVLLSLTFVYLGLSLDGRRLSEQVPSPDDISMAESVLKRMLKFHSEKDVLSETQEHLASSVLYQYQGNLIDARARAKEALSAERNRFPVIRDVILEQLRSLASVNQTDEYTEMENLGVPIQPFQGMHVSCLVSHGAVENSDDSRGITGAISSSAYMPNPISIFLSTPESDDSGDSITHGPVPESSCISTSFV